MDLGNVEIIRSVTVQVVQFHPVSVSVALRLPIYSDETPEQAIERVDGIVSDVLDVKVNEVIDDGFKWTGSGGTAKNGQSANTHPRKRF